MSEKENRIRRLVRILPWLALGCAFGPVLIQLADAIPEIPFGWSVLLAPALMISLAARDRQRALPRRGWAQALFKQEWGSSGRGQRRLSTEASWSSGDLHTSRSRHCPETAVGRCDRCD